MKSRFMKSSTGIEFLHYRKIKLRVFILGHKKGVKISCFSKFHTFLKANLFRKPISFRRVRVSSQNNIVQLKTLEDPPSMHLFHCNQSRLASNCFFKPRN